MYLNSEDLRLTTVISHLSHCLCLEDPLSFLSVINHQCFFPSRCLSGQSLPPNPLPLLQTPVPVNSRSDDSKTRLVGPPPPRSPCPSIPSATTARQVFLRCYFLYLCPLSCSGSMQPVIFNLLKSRGPDQSTLDFPNPPVQPSSCMPPTISLHIITSTLFLRPDHPL